MDNNKLIQGNATAYIYGNNYIRMYIPQIHIPEKDCEFVNIGYSSGFNSRADAEIFINRIAKELNLTVTIK